MILQILAKDSLQITYRPEINKVTGSVTATILLQQVLFRFDTNKNKAFYKFKEPCNSPHYREGDSWCEELGFTKWEFEGALKIIGQKVSRKVEKNEKALVWFWTDMDRRTWYEPNLEAIELVLKEVYAKSVKLNLRKEEKPVYVKRKNHPTKTEISVVDIYTENTTENTTESTLSIPRTNFLKTPPKNQPDEQSDSGGLAYNLEAGKIAAQFFCKTYLELNPDWKNSQYALPYFQNLQKKGEWFVLQIPEKTMTRQRWIGQHLSGIDQWASRESRFFKTGTNKYPNVTSPMPVYVMPKPNYSIED